MKTLIAAAVLAVSIAATGAQAAVSPDEAKQLGTTLTEFGAEKAGTADGSIPPYTGGGFPGMPPNFDPSTGHYSSPYAAEKPLVTIDAQNYAQYSANLLPAVIKLFQTYPSFHINVYPTHRTETYPQWVLDNTVKNATSAKLVGDIQGDGVAGAYGGIPFPIPKNGNEVMWNYVLRWQPVYYDERGPNYLVDGTGHRTLLGEFDNKYADLFYDQNQTGLRDNYFYKQLDTGEAPSSQVGYNILIEYSTNYSEADQLTFVYTPGQRRVRVAPEFSYDTPAANFGGALTYDEIYMFAGRQDRFDFKLIGKKDIYIPYNVQKVNSADMSLDDVLTPKHPNPDAIRWEKHRVWVVDSTLKAGKRDILERRTFYFDEDSWICVASEGYDHGGNLYRIGLDFPYLVWSKDASFLTPTFYTLMDLNKGTYFINTGSPTAYMRSSAKTPDLSRFTPQRLEAMGVR